MKNIKIIFMTLITLLFTQPLFATSELTPADQLAKLLDQFTTVKANFTQETLDIYQHVLARSKGTMMLAKPNHFRWDTQLPTHQIVITDGTTLWVYDVDLKQATKQKIENNAMNPAKLLSGNTDQTLKQFDVRMIPHKSIVVFQLTPKNSKEPFTSIAIAFTHDKLSSMHIETAQKQMSIFNFSNVKLNAHLSPDLFQFTVPAGVDVLQSNT